jgi:valyl-tRNA synthetase
MALYGKADHDRDMRACDDMDVLITRKQLAGDMNGLEAKALHDKVETIRKLYDKKLNATRFILMMNKGSKTKQTEPFHGTRYREVDGNQARQLESAGYKIKRDWDGVKARTYVAE